MPHHPAQDKGDQKPEGSRLQGRRPSTRIRSLVDRFEGSNDAAGPAMTPHARGPRRASLATVTNVNTSQEEALRGGASPWAERRRQSLPMSASASSPGAGAGLSNRGTTIRAAVGDMNWEPITTARGAQRPPPAYRYWSNPSPGSPLSSPTAAAAGIHLSSRHPHPTPAQQVSPSLRKVDAHGARPLPNLAIEMSPRLTPVSAPSPVAPPSPSLPTPHIPSRGIPRSSPSSSTHPSGDAPRSARDAPVPFPASGRSRTGATQPRPSLPPSSSRSSTRDGLPTLTDDNRPPVFPEYGQPDWKNEGRPSEEEEGPFGDGDSSDEAAEGDASDADHVPLFGRPVDGNDEEAALGLKPYPARDVFADAAAPLHLPDLDAFLASEPLFCTPRFSSGRQLSTEEEAELYGYARTSGEAGQLEVCGAQFSVPREATKGSARRRRPTRAVESNEGEQGSTSDEALTLIGDNDDDSEKKVFPSYNPNSSVSADSEGVPSGLSTQSHPVTRLDMFPPLMLLRSSTLNELKSNAVGPRAPPGGFLGSLPGIGSILGTIVDFVIGMEGSTFAAGIFRLELFRDFVQIMALNLHFTPRLSDNRAQRVLLYYVPSFLALDFANALGGAIIILVVWIATVALLLYAFWDMTTRYNPNRTIEGYSGQPWLFRLTSKARLQKVKGNRGKGTTMQPQKSTAMTKFVNVAIVMLLTTLYIPLSKLCMDALTWNADFWPVANPYLTEENPNPPALGDPHVFRDPLDFCYTTTMRRDQFNWAYVVIPLAVATLMGYTLWFPYKLRKAIKSLLPKVHEYNELGIKRTPAEMENEYQRLLDRDSTPLNFLYNAYRRQWGNYKPLYILCFKLSTLLIISIFTKDNCIWRTKNTRLVLVIQQTVLICLQAVLMAAHIIVKPFVDPISNRSEMVSRVGYVLTATIGLLVALQVQGSTVYNTTILYIIQAFSYTGNIYFSLAGAGWMEHLIKRWQSRVDFSIDVFSPLVNLRKHIKRRVWEETLSTVLLCAAPYHMPLGHLVTFSTDDDWPPYLLNFQGSAAERHVENLKILKAIGLTTYRKHVEELRMNDDRARRFKKVARKIQRSFAGPDAYWRPLNPPFADGVSSWFGKAFLVPFPPTLLIRYDEARDSEDKMVALTQLEDLEAFVWQNEQKDVKERRWVRLALRALDGQEVHCPHVEAIQYGPDRNIFGLRLRQRYTLARPVFYDKGTLRVKRKEHAAWPTYNFASGFDVEITYTSGQRQDPEGLTVDRISRTIDGATAFGLHNTFALTRQVKRFLRDNQSVLEVRMPLLRDMLQNYRDDFVREAIQKEKIMDYAFLTDIFDRPCLTLPELRACFETNSSSAAIRGFPHRYRAATNILFERLNAINRSKVHQWWWLYWDDLWRQNSGDYKLLRKHRRFFSPAFPSSVAYRPMPRAELERELDKRGLWVKEGTKGIFTRGSLNAIFFVVDEIAFAKIDPVKSHSTNCRFPTSTTPSKRPENGSVVRVGLTTLDGKAVEPISYESVDSSLDPMSRFTGGGTAHDQTSILNRRAWTWTEQRLSRGKPNGRLARIKNSILEWLAIRPYPINMSLRDLHLYLALVQDPARPGSMRYVTSKRKGKGKSTLTS
ncbi:hypothetical protein FA10DRAFT_145352 [Acaromyces ingoldii]|uniref:Uncharacterized protein n=1 Tax=Acaromyces ingoldii TaxID=215250 RepID=A0A316YJR4_9BASI|nr:hypothetical protein FA10DRAFT_145352 [Acaromyces ingoldii]PWN89441.1 hypothetical protein FA10DRAFT_145352 [Acaromyces ingoldii]